MSDDRLTEFCERVETLCSDLLDEVVVYTSAIDDRLRDLRDEAMQFRHRQKNDDNDFTRPLGEVTLD